ncbi:unnamed protein product, partial [Didymodactylos carnosus]
EEIVVQLGYPSEIISDWGKLFIAEA